VAAGLTEDIPGAMRESRKVISRWHGAGDGRIRVRIEASLISQCTDEMIRATKALADEHGLGWAIHHQERLATSTVDPRKGDPSLDRFQGRAIEYLDHLGVLDPASLLVHSTFANEVEIGILARTRAAVAHCPVANAWGGRSQIAAVPSMLREGVIVGLGTDGALTNNSLDLFQTMKFCALIHKVNHGDTTAMTAEKVIELSTIDSARALQMDESVGSLKPGKRADIILLDMETPGLTPSLLPVKNVVYSAASGRSVETVIVDGRPVMENGVISTFDEAEAYRAGEEAAWRMMEQSGVLKRDPGHLSPAPWRYE
jgi:5-methylthioadenosine/S-adenosylhomocysteine deaminase